MHHFKIGDDEVLELGRAPGSSSIPAGRLPHERVRINGVAIEDTFAEAFGMRATRLVITAAIPSGRATPPPRQPASPPP